MYSPSPPSGCQPLSWFRHPALPLFFYWCCSVNLPHTDSLPYLRQLCQGIPLIFPNILLKLAFYRLLILGISCRIGTGGVHRHLLNDSSPSTFPIPPYFLIELIIVNYLSHFHLCYIAFVILKWLSLSSFLDLLP